MTEKPKIALCMGDAAGIGPELLIKAQADDRLNDLADFLLYGEPDVLYAMAQQLQIQLKSPVVQSSKLIDAVTLQIGKADAKCGLAAFKAFEKATYDALNHKVDAIVTAPVNKYSVNLSGIEFTGHTEAIAEMCKVKDFAMMQSSGRLHVAFVTTHVALKDAVKEMTFKRITDVALMLDKALKSEGIPSPEIAVMAINPHGGENGFMGDEDEKITKKAIEFLQNSGLNVDGPIVPDVMFVNHRHEKYDGIISMYHDQGHIPFKMLAFDSGVNSTLGLPIIRCSPDHGSAFDIAGKNQADCGSFFAAVELAVKRAKRK